LLWRPPTPTKGISVHSLQDSDQPRTRPPLSDQHRKMLEEGSGISADVIAERGVRTIRRGRELPEGFAWRQKKRAPGVLFVVHRPGGTKDHIFRPDKPDPENPGLKYEARCKALGAPGNVLDVHPSRHPLIDRMDVPVMFCEGIKKADAITSAARAAGVEVLAVAISGVWNWLSEKKPIPDMFDIPVEGRKVTICFDSDKLHNPDVQDAERRLAEHLAGRGAEVWSTYLPEKDDGSKMGADDFFASEAGGTLSELSLLTRRYDPADVVSVRLSRDERLQLALANLNHRFWAFEWKGMGGHSARDAFKVALDVAAESGKPHKDGVRIIIAQRRWARLAKISIRTLGKALDRLEEWGLGYRDNEDRKPEKAGAFVLRASVGQYGKRDTARENATKPLQTFHGGVLHLRASRLRWSDPGRKPRRGVVKETRMVRQGARIPQRDPIKRLGKIRGAVIDALEASAGVLTLEQLATALHKKRPRELVRCKSKGSRTGRNGPAIMLLQAGIVEWACEVVTRREVLRLTDNWLEALEDARQLGKEVEADERDQARHRRQSEAFRQRHKAKADEAPAEDEMRGRREGSVGRRRQAIEAAIAELFRERPEYRGRRVGQVTCAIVHYLGPDFPPGLDGLPKDAEVEAILEGMAA
jgi:hypothetical protein